jgi:regulator of sigma E protease
VLTFFAFIFTIGIIVTVHEYGHFQVARWCGVKVIRFSIGFGKPIWRKTVGADETEFVLASIPLGGYVKMLDERELNAEIEAGEAQTHHYSEVELARAFNRQSVYKRIAIVLAGPMANLLLAIVIYWFLFMQGVTGILPIIGHVESNSIAAQANFTAGEVIQTINDKPIKTWSDATWLLLESALENKTVEIRALNQSNELHLHQVNLTGLGKAIEHDILKEIGISIFRPDVPPILAQVVSNGAAERAGLLADDKILSIDDLQTGTWREVVNIVQASPNKSLNFTIQRQEQVVTKVVTPEAATEHNAVVGKIGAGVKLDKQQLDQILVNQHYSSIDSLQMAISKTWKTASFSLK